MSNNLGNKKVMSENIKHYMSLRGVERNDICKELNIKYSTFSDWVNANTYPRIDKIELMAKYFGITKADLVEPSSAASKADSVIRLPVLGDIAGGVPIEALTQTIDPDDPDSWEEIPSSWAASGKEFLALKVSGDSMEPRISDGDIAILERCYDFVNGAVMAVYVNGYNATLKRVRVMPNGILMLESFNPDHESKVFTDEEVKKIPVKPLGLLVETRAKWN